MSRLVAKGWCTQHCEDLEENRGKRLSKYPGLAILQKKCKVCSYWCYKTELGSRCPCCNRLFRMG